MGNKFFAFWLGSLVFSLFSHPVYAQRQAAITLSPPEVTLAGPPGSSVAKDIVVGNQGDGAFLLECNFNDLWYEKDHVKFSELGTQKERQAGPWLRCLPNRILVPAQGLQKVKVVAAIPKEAEGESFSMLFTEMRPPQEIKKEAQENLSLAITGRLGARIIVTAQGTEKPSVDIPEARVKPSKKFQVVSIEMKNTGNVHLGGKGTLVITGGSDQVAGKVDVQVPFLFPGQSKSFTVNLIDPIPAGVYKGLLSVSGSQTSAAFLKEFSIKVGG